MDALSVHSVLSLLFIYLSYLLDVSVADECAVSLMPTIEPPHLVVEYRGPASAICTTNQSVDDMNWEASDGVKRKIDEQSMVWSVSSIPWSLGNGVQCYTNSDAGQCLQHLPITIYKTPDSVTAELVNHPGGPLLEGHQYTLECKVKSVAPVRNLSVILQKEDQVVAQTSYTQFSSSVEGKESEDVDVTATFPITASMDDNAAGYRCAAKLDLLGAIEPIPDSVSNITQLEVLYEPRMLNVTGNVTVKAGDKLMLACRANANPAPSYQWKHNGAALANQKSNTLQLDAIGEANGGVYECTATNTQGEVSARMTVTVETQGSTGGIIAAVLICIVVLGIVAFCIWKKYGKQ